MPQNVTLFRKQGHHCSLFRRPLEKVLGLIVFYRGGGLEPRDYRKTPGENKRGIIRDYLYELQGIKWRKTGEGEAGTELTLSSPPMAGAGSANTLILSFWTPGCRTIHFSWTQPAQSATLIKEVNMCSVHFQCHPSCLRKLWTGRPELLCQGIFQGKRY